MSFKVEILRLSEKFYEDYPISKYPEILDKSTRSYVCLIIKVRDYNICIPYRSNVSHKDSYRFRYSQRSKDNKSGLDYRKIAIIKNPHYLEKTFSVVDNDEYRETMMNIEKIVSSAEEYIDTYTQHITGIAILHKREFERRYTFSTLKYFHNELRL